MGAPNKCPACGKKNKWTKVKKWKENSNPVGAIVGFAIGGPLGALAGSGLAPTKKYVRFTCGNCGFTGVYRD